ncbi:ankyrin repeat domain-containing protein [Candidatus Lariskella endosymbiont of Epinotia ramella]|uniref:ankyrin repeat domain-containing protein n=1 Tax=Candidatus Lariskella endosymbiont of Epinotia ramella TaxID=3066224 RepID=UPI0030CE4084
MENQIGNLALHIAAKNPASLKLLIDLLGEEVLNIQDSNGNTILHFANINNLDSLKLLVERFGEQVLKVQNNHGNTALHWAVNNHPSALELLIDVFKDKVLEVKNHGSNTALHFAAAHNPDSLSFFIKKFGKKVLQVQNNHGNTILHVAAINNLNSLKLLVDTFGEKMLLSKNNFGHTASHFAAKNNTKSLEFLIDKLGVDVLDEKDNSGNTALSSAAEYNPESLKLLIEKFPEKVKSLLHKEDIFGRTVMDLVANNPNSLKLINDFLDGNKIYGAESGISIPEIPAALSYYYQDQVSLLLKLRIEDAKPGALKSVDVLEANYTLRENNSDDIAAKLSSFILASAKETILMPLNIGGKHLVGIAARKHGDRVVLHYMDSERNPLPASLFAKVRAELESRGYSTERVIAEIEKQHYSNCGPEVIENLTAFASGKKRTSQEKAIPKHSTLFEEHLLKDSSKGESTDDSSTNDSSAHESTGDSSTGDSNIYANIIKSMPVLSESATTLGNMESLSKIV